MSVERTRFCYVCGKPSVGRQCKSCFSMKAGMSPSRIMIQRRHNHSRA